MAKKPGPLQQAQAITRAQYAPVDYQLGQASKRATAEQHALNAARTALIAQLQGGVAPATQAYDAAAQQTQDIARSAADLLAQANPNAQVQQSLAQVNAPQEQRQQLGQSLQSLFPGAGAVLNVEQGAIPGAGLVAQGAAQKQFLAGLPTVAALSGEQSLRSLLANQQKTRDDLVAQRLGIGGQLPGLVRDLQNRQEDVQYRDQQAANAIQQAALDRSFRAQQAQKDRAFREMQASLDYQRSLNPTPLQLAQLNLEQRKLNADIAATNAQTAAVKKGGGLTPYQSLTLKERQREFNLRQGATNRKSAAGATTKPTPEEIRKYAETAYYGVKPTPRSVTQPDGSTKIVQIGGTPAIGYQKALSRLQHTYGLKLAQAQSVLNDFYAPGEDGRPLFDYQHRKALGVTDTGKKLPKRKRK